MNESNTPEMESELRHRERQIAAIRHLSDALFSQLSVDDLIRKTLTVAIEVLDADTGSVQMHDAAAGTLVFRYVAAPEDEFLIGHATPIDRGISGRVFRTGVSDLAADVQSDADFNSSVDSITGYRTRSALTVALKRQGRTPIGVMQVLNMREPFSERDLEVLEVLGAQAATAIENARLTDLARRAELVSVIGNVSHDIYNTLTPLETGLQYLQSLLDTLFSNIESLSHQCPAPEWGEQLRAAAEDPGFTYPWIIEQALISNKRVQARTRWIAGAVKGKLPRPVFETANLNDTARQVAGALKLLAGQVQVQLHLDLDETLPDSRFDSEHIYNALYNLANNALPATPPGGSITLRTRAPGEGEGHLLLEVSDTGRGMEEAARTKLFTDEMVSTTPGGTGLGTRIVKHVVEQHNGRIEVQSEVGRGSTFSIWLPL